jgi:hypothetical protein
MSATIVANVDDDNGAARHARRRHRPRGAAVVSLATGSTVLPLYINNTSVG